MRVSSDPGRSRLRCGTAREVVKTEWSPVLGIERHRLTAYLALLETFVHSQIQRALGWSRTRASLSHWRDPRGREVDLVIEAPDGRIVGIEVKAAASVTTDDTVGLRALAEVAGPRFVHGFVLHLGERCTRFGSDITAAPASHLWLG